MNYSSRENDSHHIPSHPIPSHPFLIPFHIIFIKCTRGGCNEATAHYTNNVDIIHNTYIHTYIYTYIHMCYVCLQNLQLNKLLFFNIHTHIHMYVCFAKFCNLVNYYFSTNIIVRPTPKTVTYFTTIITILWRTKGVLVGPWPRPLKGKKKKKKKKRGPPMCLICGIWDSHVFMSGDSLFLMAYYFRSSRCHALVGWYMSC